MKHLLPIVVALCIATTAGAQSAAPSASALPDSMVKAIVGTWEGNYESDHAPPGAFRLVVAHDSLWHVTSSVSMQGETMASAVTDFAIDGAFVTWTQAMMGLSCRGRATLAAGTLRGETTCEMGSIGYLLRRK